MLYALPKLHKPNIPFRPIVSTINNPLSNIAKKTAQFLANTIPPSEYSIKNSKEFLTKIKHIDVNKDDLILSLDVVSLFTNIPISPFLNILENTIKKLPNFTTEQLNDIKSITHTLLLNNQFQFDYEYYKLKDGCPMGSSISPIIAEIFLSQFEIDYVKTYKYTPKFYCRYVDDVFMVWEHGEHNLLTFIEYLNSCYPSINFKLELMCNNSINFLDINISIDSNSKLKFLPFYKPTHTGTYLHKTSFHPLSQKIGLYFNMFYKLNYLNISGIDLNKEINTIINFGIKSGFSRNIMINIFNKTKYNINLRNTTTLSSTSSKKFISLNWTNDLKFFKSNDNFKIAFKPPPSIGKRLISRLKDVVPQIDKPGIYKINCSQCISSYIGQTKRSLQIRMTEHERDLRLEKVRSVFLPHVSMTGHNIDFDNIKLIDRYDGYHSTNIRESFSINANSNGNLLNSDKGPYNLSQYFPIKKTFSNNKTKKKYINKIKKTPYNKIKKKHPNFKINMKT